MFQYTSTVFRENSWTYSATWIEASMDKRNINHFYCTYIGDRGSTYLLYLLTHLLTYLLIYLLTLLTYLLTYFTYLLYLLTYLPTYLLIYLLTLLT